MFPSGTEGVKQCEFNGKCGTWNIEIYGYANCMISAYLLQKVTDMLVLPLENVFDKNSPFLSAQSRRKNNFFPSVSEGKIVQQ